MEGLAHGSAGGQRGGRPIGAIRALRLAGLDAPKDLSVVSFNDTPRSALVEPPLTSVSAHVEEMARTALRLLRERVALPGREPERTVPLKVVVPSSLIRAEQHRGLSRRNDQKHRVFSVKAAELSESVKDGLNF